MMSLTQHRPSRTGGRLRRVNRATRLDCADSSALSRMGVRTHAGVPVEKAAPKAPHSKRSRDHEQQT